MKYLINKTLLGIKIWFALSLIIPVAITILMIFAAILGVEFPEGGFFVALIHHWRVYYYDGFLEGFMAFRIHILLLVIAIFASILDIWEVYRY